MDKNELNYTNTLIDLERKEKNLNSLIAKELLRKLKIDKKLDFASSLSKEINVSNSQITKFIKKLELYDWSTLRYIHNNLITSSLSKNLKVNAKIEQLSEQIIRARKIFFIGTSTNLIINKDLSLKLQRLDKWTVTANSKYEQIGLSRLLIKVDLLIVNSISLQHPWMVDIINKTNARVIVFTANPDNIKRKNDIVIYNLSSKKHDVSPTRLFTTGPRRKVLEIYDEIYANIISKPENLQLLKLTSYN